MTYLKKIIYSLREIIISYLLEYLIIIIFCIIYKTFISNNLKYFINNHLQYISIISLIIITSYLYKQNKRKESKIVFKYIPLFISIGISISCFLNMIIFKVFTPIESTNNVSIPLIIISSGIIGPIYEEILFRYINLHNLKKFNSPTKSIIINCIIFSIIHFNIKEIIFAFILSFIINLIYKKFNNILYPIIIHSSTNIISLFLIEFNQSILLLSLISIMINYEIIRKLA